MKLIKGGRLVSGQATWLADLAIDGGVIAAIGADLTPGAGDTVIDASGCLVFPGFIDPHTHFDLNTGACVTADDFASGTLAALVGGTTTIIDYATQEKGMTLSEALAQWHKKAEGASSCDYAFHMAIGDWQEETRRELPAMIEAGVTTFKLYLAYDNLRVDDAALMDILTAIHAVGGLTGVHCENGLLVNALIEAERRAGHLTPAAHPRSRPPELEAEAISRLTYIAKLVDCPVCVVHISSELGLREVEKARALGVRVVAETCPQYLIFTDEVYDQPDFEGAKFVCSPPIRKDQDREALQSALLSGVFDTLATDHCSFNFAGQKSMGRGDFSRIPNGLPGVEHRPALFYTQFVATGRASPQAMCRLLSENAARIYGMYPQKGALQVGSDADIVVWADCAEVIRADTQSQRVDYTPYEGRAIAGHAQTVLLHGEVVVEGAKPIAAGRGRYVPRDLPTYDV